MKYLSVQVFTKAPKFLRNVGWSSLDYISSPILLLISIPTFIITLGPDSFGVWVLINSLIGVGAVFNFGFGETSIKYVSGSLSVASKTKAGAVIQTLAAIATVSGTCVSIFVYLFSEHISWALNISSVPDATAALAVAGLLVPLKMLEGIFASALKASGDYAQPSAQSLIFKISTLASQIWLVVNGFGIFCLISASLLFMILNSIILYIFASLKYGPCYPKFNRLVFNFIKHYAFWSWCQGISGILYANLDKIIVSIFLGPAALAIYGACIQLAQSIQQGIAAAGHSLFPVFSRISSANEPQRDERIRQIYSGAGDAITVVAVTLGMTGFIFSDKILLLWVGPEFARSGSVVLAFLCLSYGWFTANSVITYYTLNGMGYAKLQTVISAIGAVIMVISTFGFIQIWGLVGAAAARLPDALFRACGRAYVGRRIVGSQGALHSLDFLAVTLTTGTALWVTRHLVETWLPASSDLFHLGIGASIAATIILARVWAIFKTRANET